MLSSGPSRKTASWPTAIPWRTWRSRTAASSPFAIPRWPSSSTRAESPTSSGPASTRSPRRRCPILTYLMNWDKAFKSPFKSDVYYFSTRVQTDQRWGTATPITIRDKEFGAIRMRGYGIYAYKIADPKLFHQKISGTRDIYHVADLEGQLRNTIVARMTDTFAQSTVPFLDMAANQQALGDKDRRESEAVLRRFRPLARKLRGRKHLAAGRAAEDAGSAHQHEHDRRHGQVHAVPGGAIAARSRPRTKAEARRASAWAWAQASPWRQSMMNAMRPQEPGAPPAPQPGGALRSRRQRQPLHQVLRQLRQADSEVREILPRVRQRPESSGTPGKLGTSWASVRTVSGQPKSNGVPSFLPLELICVSLLKT